MNPSNPFTRRQALKSTACGFGYLAFADLASRVSAFAASPAARANPLAPKDPMFGARAKRVIFLFMNGAPSHVDTFDYKPELNRRHGQTAEFQNTRNRQMEERTLFGSPFEFQQHGGSGAWVSDLFPHVARHVDDLCMIKSVHTDAVAHGPATLFMHTGSSSLVRPSIGSWVTYGLGSESENLPGFVTICPSAFIGGVRNYGSAFLPSVYQGTAIGKAERPATEARFKNLRAPATIDPAYKEQFDFLRRLNQSQRSRESETDALDATIDSFETAFRMQQHAPTLTDLSGESEATRVLYGIDQAETEDFGRQCLLARRLSEAGVRFIQVNYSDNTTTPKWDQHRNLPTEHAEHARAVDRPIAALLSDLKQRGLLEDTLVWWGGEFGRTPYSENDSGRDHNPHAATVWLAGGGVKGGHAHGATDELGFKAIHDKVHVHDLHATILHLLGIDHERLTYRFSGRDFRLTDVAGEVVHEILS